MAFRKTRSMRPRRKFGAKMARRRKTWEQFNIDPCNPVVLNHCEALDGCCTDIVRIELLGNATLQAQFSDRCSVVRVLGDLWFQPNFGTVTSVSDITNWIGYLNAVQQFIGLRRGEITSQQPLLASLDIWDPSFDDLSEGQWFKTWQRLVDPISATDFGEVVSSESAFSMFFPVATNDTHTFVVPGTTACNALASGTGDICIETETDIDCMECGQTITAGQIQFNNVSNKLVQPWHVHFDVKKRVPLRENQALYLVYNQRHYSPLPPSLTADSFTAIRGNVRTLIEMG